MARMDYTERTVGGISATRRVGAVAGCHDASMTSRPAEIEDHDDSTRPEARLEPLVLVTPARPRVVRTFADGEEILRTWSRLRRVEWTVPAGLVHAADLDADAVLCGTPLTSLQEFGRSRFPFERVPDEDRCRACDDAAGSPQA
jgi:hypothetical protein